ncbi:MAG: DUF4845 domain-containing protein [Gammaproteobacteria bacterium]
MIKTNRQQQGMTMISWMVVLSAIGFIVFITLKIMPIYLGGYNSYSSVESMTKERNLGSKTLTEVKEMLWRRLDVNMVAGVTKNDIFVTKGKGELVIELDYEIRENIVGNLDVVVHFNKKVSVPTGNAAN